MTGEGWASLSADQRYAVRAGAWSEAEGLESASPEVEAAYGERVTLLRDAVELRRPSRVPISPLMELFPARCAGGIARDACYAPPKLAQAMRRFHEGFMPDTIQS
jgi:hypothetical protein